MKPYLILSRALYSFTSVVDVGYSYLCFRSLTVLALAPELGCFSLTGSKKPRLKNFCCLKTFTPLHLRHDIFFHLDYRYGSILGGPSGVKVNLEYLCAFFRRVVHGRCSDANRVGL